MNWEELTAKDFEKFSKRVDVCIIAFGVIERHGDHLPLGTDFLNGHKIISRAAQLEEAMVFPPFYFGQIFEACCFPGTIALKPTLLMDLVFNVFDEIARNGFKKIIIYNAHGGNDAFLKFITQCQLAEEKDYYVYMYNPFTAERAKIYQEICETKIHGHACECETSISLFNHSKLVKMDYVRPGEVGPKGNLNHLNNLFSSLSWYGNYPEHYVGDASKASYEKGKKIVEFEIKQLAEFIKQVKEDQSLPSLAKEFHHRNK